MTRSQGRLSHRRGTLSRIRVEDALLDIAEAEGLEEFVATSTEALRRHTTSPGNLVRVLNGRTRMRHRRAVLELLGDFQGLESNLEFRYRRDVERAHQLPTAHRQISVLVGSRIDCWYSPYGVLVELDGRRGHEDSVFRDLSRDNAHALVALTTLRYGSHDVRLDPCRVAAQVAAALRLRGWDGDLTPCPRCSRGRG